MFSYGIRNIFYIKKMKRKFRKAGNIKPASTGMDMDQYYYWIKDHSKLHIKNVFEIGANYGQDAERLRYLFDLPKEYIYIYIYIYI